MTTRDEGLPSGAQQADALDAFLNGHAHGNPPPETGVDPALARTARRLQGLADATLDAHLDDGREARTWEALMRDTSARPRLIAVPAAVLSTQRPGITTTSPAMSSGGRADAAAATASARVVPLRPAAPPSRLRRVGSQSLGLVATLTLVAMIGLSGLAVYLSAPRPDEPGGLPLLAGVSPTAEIAPADLRAIVPSACVQEPRDYDELMGLIAARLSVGQMGGGIELEPGATSVPNPIDPGLPSFQLPDGPAPDEATQAAVVGVLDQFTGCTALRAASLTTDDYWARIAHQSDGGALNLVLLWSDSQFDPTTWAPEPDSSPPTDIEAARPGGGLPLYEAYGFRLIDGERVGAYLRPGTRLTGPEAGPSEAVNAAFDHRGYVILRRQGDGRWLIDELKSPPFPAPTTCSYGCATPAAS